MPRKSPRKSPIRRVKKSPIRKTPNAYHVSVKLRFNINDEHPNQTTRKDVLQHLKDYLNGEDVSELISYGYPVKNLRLKEDTITFDVPLSFTTKNRYVNRLEDNDIYSAEDLEYRIKSSSLADGSWESFHSNFFHMVDNDMADQDKDHAERATISPSVVKVSRKFIK
jgi:hypothetical protein